MIELDLLYGAELQWFVSGAPDVFRHLMWRPYCLALTPSTRLRTAAHRWAS